jgi:hypothetical protein
MLNAVEQDAGVWCVFYGTGELGFIYDNGMKTSGKRGRKYLALKYWPDFPIPRRAIIGRARTFQGAIGLVNKHASRGMYGPKRLSVRREIQHGETAIVIRFGVISRYTVTKQEDGWGVCDGCGGAFGPYTTQAAAVTAAKLQIQRK